MKHFFKTEYFRLVQFVKKRIDDTANLEPEDFVQEVIANVYALTDIENITAYFFRALRNELSDFYKKKDRIKHVSLDKYMTMDDGSNFDPSIISDNKDRQIMINEAIDSLDPHDKEIVIATFFEGKTFKELSKSWGIPINTLLSRRARALQKLKKILKEV
ncbi:MAG: hypothetical protein A2Y40_03245 [Candidatus Margulisbacteria bacterium GWF2_35_9]|nr:MAG: hypothetical protein A2Y40_03245 [Candidatus Margulisbacteria bacterium GWF2_35_9]